MKLHPRHMAICGVVMAGLGLTCYPVGQAVEPVSDWCTRFNQNRYPSVRSCDAGACMAEAQGQTVLECHEDWFYADDAGAGIECKYEWKCRGGDGGS